jgi:hypothetical protein
MELMPWHFTRYVDAPEGAPDGFRLAPGGPDYQVVLAKRGEIGPKGAPCIFLLTLNDGHAQCGLGELRPAACHVYPATLVDNLLRCEGRACTCRRWSVLDLDADRDRARLNRMLEEAEEYCRVVTDWNGQIDGGKETRTYRDFCLYVLGAYRALYGGSP